MNLKYDKLLSNFGFNCKLRHYVTDKNIGNTGGLGGAMHVDPGFSQLTPLLVSTLETII